MYLLLFLGCTRIFVLFTTTVPAQIIIESSESTTLTDFSAIPTISTTEMAMILSTSNSDILFSDTSSLESSFKEMSTGTSVSGIDSSSTDLLPTALTIDTNLSTTYPASFYSLPVSFNTESSITPSTNTVFQSNLSTELEGSTSASTILMDTSIFAPTSGSSTDALSWTFVTTATLPIESSPIIQTSTSSSASTTTSPPTDSGSNGFLTTGEIVTTICVDKTSMTSTCSTAVSTMGTRSDITLSTSRLLSTTAAASVTPSDQNSTSIGIYIGVAVGASLLSSLITAGLILSVIRCRKKNKDRILESRSGRNSELSAYENEASGRVSIQRGSHNVSSVNKNDKELPKDDCKERMSATYMNFNLQEDHPDYQELGPVRFSTYNEYEILD